MIWSALGKKIHMFLKLNPKQSRFNQNNSKATVD